MRITRTRSVVSALVLGLLVASDVRPPEPVAEPEGEERASLRLVLNVSARRLHVYENGERTRSYRVAVGTPGHPTPRGNYKISRVIWNPWWHPPQREWARGEKPTPPGPNNPMGRVKMYFRNLYYIHGTPHEGSLGRAASHGCVRMSNSDAIELARLVHEYGSPNVSKSQLDRLVRNPKQTKEIWLKNPVPLEIVTSTADVIDGELELYTAGRDVSDVVLREEALQALADAGFDLSVLDRERLRDLIRISRRAPVSAPLEELVAPTAAAASSEEG